jgi:hypothetical protein
VSQAKGPVHLAVLDAERVGIDVSPAWKVALFRERFRGRDDVYAKLWANTRTGKTGYAPACANEWVRGTCGKPRVPCRSCDHQAFLTVDDKVVLDHLRGRHVIGVYPLLRNDACWFLAIDLDEHTWEKDVAALRATSDATEVPILVDEQRHSI